MLTLGARHLGHHTYIQSFRENGACSHQEQNPNGERMSFAVGQIQQCHTLYLPNEQSQRDWQEEERYP